jgi:hypothetical protein
MGMGGVVSATARWPEYRADCSSSGSAMIKENTWGFTGVTVTFILVFFYS